MANGGHVLADDVNPARHPAVSTRVTPVPTPTPSPASVDINWDAVSGIADSVMAIATIATLIFIAVTVRQQGKALGLQIKQLQDLQAGKEEARAAAERSQQEYKTRRARNVRVTPRTLHPLSEFDRAQAGVSPSHRLSEMINDALLARKREKGEVVRSFKWQAAAIWVHNQSGEVIYNVSSHGDEQERPTWIWRENVELLLDIYELDQLAPDTSAWYVWPDQDERVLAQKNVRIHFSDEDSARWATDLHGHTTRVDRLST